MRILAPETMSSYESRLSPAEVLTLTLKIQDITKKLLATTGKQLVYVVKETDFSTDEDSYRIGIGSINAKSYTVKTLEEAAKRIAALVTLEA